MRLIGWLVAGLLVAGTPVTVIFGENAGVVVGVIAGVVLYLISICPHCGKSTPSLAPVCPYCGRRKRGTTSD